MGKDKVKPVCCHCGKQFTTTSNMYQHIREVHGLEPVNFGRLKCPTCGVNFANYEGIRNHVSREHNVKCPLEEHIFTNEKDFYEWKHKIEEELKCLYVRHSAPRLSAAKENVYYYICHRSGQCKSRSTGKRHTKIGSSKMNAHCPSTMMVRIARRVHALFCPTHYGHDASVARGKQKGQLPDDTNNDVTDKINEGSKSSLQKILDDVQHGAEEFQQIQSLTRKDVLSVKKDFIVQESDEGHENEASSIRVWVESVSELEEDNPIIFYKDQGAADMTGFLSDEDYCLIIMAKHQQKMLTDFCNPKICIDSTHGTSTHDYYLITMLTVDEFDVGCPVAFCICNRTDIEVINFFFNYIRSKVGVISTNIFISDDAPEFYNAWEVVMGATQHQLLCAWLVDRNWRKNLAKITPRIKKVTVYKTLRVLIQEPDLEAFTDRERTFVKLLEDDPDTRKFKKYYSTYYGPRVQMWAFCYRKHLGINTNMYLESFHKVLKHIYLEGKKIKRLDKTLNALMKLTRDKIFESLCNVTKKISSTSIPNVPQNNCQSNLISEQLVTPVIDDKEWKVKSTQEDSVPYTVRKIVDPVCRSCRSSPTHLNVKVCAHEYECSCYNNLIRYSICEHILACAIIMENKVKKSAENQTNKLVTSQELNCNANSDMHLLFNKKLMYLKEISTNAISRSTYLKANAILDKCLTLFNEANEINTAVASVK